MEAENMRLDDQRDFWFSHLDIAVMQHTRRDLRTPSLS